MDTYTWAVAHRKPYIVCESGFDQTKIVTTTAGRFDKDGHVTGSSLIETPRRHHGQTRNWSPTSPGTTSGR